VEVSIGKRTNKCIVWMAAIDKLAKTVCAMRLLESEITCRSRNNSFDEGALLSLRNRAVVLG
jgi:hypothetical protein